MQKQVKGQMNPDAGAQSDSGTTYGSLPNPKMQAPFNDGSGQLGQGATGGGYGAVSGKNPGNMRGSGSSEPSDASVNPYVANSGGATPATSNGSAGRVFEIDPGKQTLGS